MENRIPVLIDTDIGDDIDDAFALCLAMQSPELRILGITTVHRCAKHRAKMAKALLTAGGFGYVPVYAGESRPLRCNAVYKRELDYNDLPHSYSEEYEKIRYDGDDAVAFLAHTLEQSEEKVTVITLGALTNIALLLQKRPDLYPKIKRLCVMGGSYSMNLGEYNFSCDPDAAAYVMGSGLPILCVGVDITFRCRLSGELLDQVLTHPHPCLQMLHRMRKKWAGEVYLHDPLALICSFNDRFVTWKPMVCVVECEAKYANGYVVNLSDFNWRHDISESQQLIAVDVDADAFTKEYVRRVTRFSKE